MNKTLFFIQISESSYDECFLIDRIESQFQGEITSIIFSNGISSSFNGSNPDRILGILTEDQEGNKERFQSALEMCANPVAIILLDVYNYFLNPIAINFLPSWLKDCEVPIFALDYFNLLEEKNNQILLKSGVNSDLFEAGESPLALDFPITLLKPIPPISPEPHQVGERTFNWNPIEKGLVSARPQLRKQILDSLKADEQTKIITLAFDPILFSQALERSLVAYYFIIIEVLVFYLRQFKGQNYKLLVIGSSPPTHECNDIPDLNVEIHYFTHFTEDNYRAFLAASDLIITNNNWSTILLDALTIGTPVAVMGNSILQVWKDEAESERKTVASFNPHGVLFDLSQMMMHMNQWSVSTPIFQFINYPIRYTEPDFPSTGLQEHVYPYFLLDMFNDQDCIPIFKDLLFSQNFLHQYRQFCESLTLVAEQGQRMQSILDQVVS